MTISCRIVCEQMDITEQASAQWSAIADQENLLPFGVAWRMLRGGRLLEKLIDEAAASHGLTVAGDFEVLAALRRLHPDPVQPAMLSTLTMVSTSGMTGRLDRLEAEGLIARESNPEDRRTVDIVLTDTGIALAELVFLAILAVFSASLASVGDRKMAQLSTSLRTVLEALGDEPKNASLVVSG